MIHRCSHGSPARCPTPYGPTRSGLRSRATPRSPVEGTPPGRRWGILRPGKPTTSEEGQAVPIATPEIYNQMLDSAKSGEYAYPAINCTSSETVNAALRGFAEAGSDGIIQFSTGGAEFGSGTGVKDMVTGATALAEFAYVVAAKYPINVALHTDHCPKDKLDTYVRPLIAHLPRAGRPRREPAVPVAHVGRLGGAARREPEDRRGPAGAGREGPDRPRDRGRRRRRRGGRRRPRDQREALHHAGRLRGHRGRAGHRREGPLPAGRHVRQRARRLQAGQRPAAPVGPEDRPGDGRRQARAWPPAASRSTWCSTAARARCSRRSTRR